MDKSHFVESAIACLDNGKHLLEDAEMLEFAEPPRSSFVLAIIAQEEFAKGFLLFLVSRDVIPWNRLTHRATRDHICKQLLGIVMEHMNPDSDEFDRRINEWHASHVEATDLLEALQKTDDLEERRKMLHRIDEINESRDLFPATVADAINILRHEKIGRYESLFCVDEEPNYDKTAKRIAEGELDREKQDALYIRLNKNGEAATIPRDITTEIVREARDRADRMGCLVEGLLRGDAGGLFDYEKVESAFKALFADLSGRTDLKSDGT